MRWDHFARWSSNAAPRLRNQRARTHTRWSSTRHQEAQQPSVATAPHGDERLRIGRTFAPLHILHRRHSGHPFMIEMRYDRVKGRELYATCDIEPHTPLLRVAPHAALQGIDAVALFHNHGGDGCERSHVASPSVVLPVSSVVECCDAFQEMCASLAQDMCDVAALHQHLPLHLLTTAAAATVGELPVRSTCNSADKVAPQCHDLQSTLHAHAESWLLGLVAAVERSRGTASPHFGYLHGCLPRRPLPSSVLGWRALGRTYIKQLTAYYALMGDSASNSLSTTANAVERALHHFTLDATAMHVWKHVMAQHLLDKLRTHSNAVGKVHPSTASTEDVVWGFDCVRSRAHPFSFHTKAAIFSPRRYPLSARVQRDTQEHTAMCSLTLCPWFDMINDGAATNVDFVDTPSSSAPASSQMVDALPHKNRDLLIEAGPAGLCAGEALTMCYAASRRRTTTKTRAEVSQATSEFQQRSTTTIDVVATLLKFGFLPADCAR